MRVLFYEDALKVVKRGRGLGKRNFRLKLKVADALQAYILLWRSGEKETTIKSTDIVEAKIYFMPPSKYLKPNLLPKKYC
jgi:hypothetical protein